MIVLSVSRCEYNIGDNMQTYRFLMQLPFRHFAMIRFTGLFTLSGSVPRRGNKQSRPFRGRELGHAVGRKHNMHDG